MNTFEQEKKLAWDIAAAVRALGGRACYVGGYVRDHLLGIECKDIDIEVSGISPAALRGALEKLGDVYERGASFGVLGLRGSDIDIAMPRTESRTGAKHTDFAVCVDPYLSPEAACRRRDFTINAMMQDVLTGEIIDIYGGQADLRSRRIRCVSADTFVEDALRAFRGAQFAARLNAEIEPRTLDLCGSMDVSALSVERVMGETEKALLKAERPSVYFEMLRRMDHLKEFFPEIQMMIGVKQSPEFHPEGDVFAHTLLVLDEAAKLRKRARQPLIFMLSALIHDVGKIVATQVQEDGRITAYGHEVLGQELAQRQLCRLTNNRDIIRIALNHTRLHMRPNMLACANSKKRKSREMFDLSLCPEDLILLSRADASGKRDAPYDARCEAWLRDRLEDYYACAARPMVTGEDLIAAGLAPGRDFAALIQRARSLHFSGLEKKNALRQVLSEYKMQEYMQNKTK